jgi:hypothetical protein
MPHDLTAAKLRELIDYDPNTGVFTWRVRAYRSKYKQGSPAGTKQSKGYLTIGVLGRSYLAHRLAWLYVYGEWPTKQVDHINQDKLDNRIANLRQATNKENHQNEGLSSNNTSGYKGVGFFKRTRRWRAHITTDGVTRHLGFFSTIDGAIAARKNAEAQIHPFSSNY